MPSDIYLSVVVTTRNDDHGGRPLQRLQAFVNAMDAQCRRTGLSAEVIVVEWNPPSDRPRLSAALKWPAARSCSFRFIEVPSAVHRALAHADALPLFQMIGKNVGIRRARGRFVLATNMDILLSTELMDFIAARRLEPRRLYRVDRRDVEADVPVDGSVEEQMAYCRSHQLRVNRRDGTFPVNASGDPVTAADDIVDGATVRLGDGWFGREGDAATGTFRWAMATASLRLAAQPASGVLELSLEPNGYEPGMWADVEIAGDAGAVVGIAHVAEPAVHRFRVPAETATVTLRVVASATEKPPTPIFERRSPLFYKVRSVRLLPADRWIPRESELFPADVWRPANEGAAFTFERNQSGVSIGSDPRQSSWCAQAGPFTADVSGTYRFALTYEASEGGVSLGLASADAKEWLPSVVRDVRAGESRALTLSADLPAGQTFLLIASNDHPSRYGASRFVLRDLTSSVPFERLAAAASAADNGTGGPLLRAAMDRLLGAGGGASVRDRARAAIVYRSPEYAALRSAYGALDSTHARLVYEVERDAPLEELRDTLALLKRYRPADLHLNACGDFQLMSRDDWFELRGYPEFQSYSMNIDGLFGTIAHYAGIREHALDMPCCIFHLEHDTGSGWTPEGEQRLRQRIAERGITWIDAKTVFAWGAYMEWLQRPMIFNSSSWGFADEALPETSV